jgi:hypothetical protein
MDYTHSPLWVDGEINGLGARMYGWRTTTTGELRLFHSDSESTNIDFVIGTVTAGMHLRLGIVQSSKGVQTGLGGTTAQAHLVDNYDIYYMNGEQFFVARPGNIGGVIPPLYEETQESPGVCVISVAGAAFRVRMAYWAFGTKVWGRNELGFVG